MSKNLIDWDNTLINDIARRKAVIVIGSGVSKNSKDQEGKSPKSWKEFLEKCMSKIKKKELKNEISKRIDNNDYLIACELIKNGMEEKKFFDEIKYEFKDKAYKPAPIHEFIFKLDLPIVITPNFDCIYDTYAISQTQGTIKVKNYSDNDIAEFIRGGEERLIIKSHGDASKPKDVIFTNQDYAKARTEHSLFYEIIKSLALTHTFLFIGCGINDRDIRALFEDIRYSYGRFLPKHYMTISEDSENEYVKNIFSTMTNITLLEYCSENNHQELTYSLETLVELVEEERGHLAETEKW